MILLRLIYFILSIEISTVLSYKHNIQKFIMKGKPTSEKKYPSPWHVRIEMSNGSICGGSVISQDTILTAAHCLNG